MPFWTPKRPYREDMSNHPHVTPRTDIRALGAIDAEPPTTATATAAIKTAYHTLAQAAPALGSAGDPWATISGTPERYRVELEAFVRDVQAAKLDQRLSVEARWSDARKVAAEFRADAERVLDAYTSAARELTVRYEARTRPLPPTSDAAVLEAQLANARSDARMVLDQASDDQAVADRLAELARGDDLALRYLLLATTWPATYMRARGLTAAPIAWQAARREVLAEVLPPAAVTALPKLDAMQHVRRAEHALRGGHGLLIVNNPALFETGPDGA